LAPLFALTLAEDIAGVARGIAFQLVEALGVLERQKVSEEVKGLDQPSRAVLRKYGVRFGAYHIYVPALLKPAPRSLATQLWALKHEGPEAKGSGALGVDTLQHVASSGRTSIAVDKEIPEALYRTSGYRVCGERAVRVDILERLADLIRPALAWRDGMTVAKPPGAFPGGGFTVTTAMTSLTGAAGEDFASILRSLNYRMDRKPKPPQASPPEAQVEHTAAEPANDNEVADAVAVSAAPAVPVEATPSVDSSSLLPPVEAAPAAPAVSAEVESASAAEASPAPAVATEPETVEVWRPQGRSQHRRENHKREKNRRQNRDHASANAMTAAVNATPGDAAASPEAKSDAAPSPRPPRHERKGGGQDLGKERGKDFKRDRDRNKDHRGPRPDREGRDNKSRRPMFVSSEQPRRDKVADPNSPFAKLAALKQQLEDAKEKH
jgi:ATP-dependent RNA helicase SUPV3L1/SUV3